MICLGLSSAELVILVKKENAHRFYAVSTIDKLNLIRTLNDEHVFIPPATDEVKDETDSTASLGGNHC